jgi:hypothetical protein
MLSQGIQDFFQLVEVLMGVIRLGEDFDTGIEESPNGHTTHS